MLVSNSVSEGFQNGSQTPLGLFTFSFIHTSSRISNEQKWRKKIIFKSMFGVCNICIGIASVSMNNGPVRMIPEPFRICVAPFIKRACTAID